MAPSQIRAIAVLIFAAVVSIAPGARSMSLADGERPSGLSSASIVVHGLIKAVKSARLATDRPGVLNVIDAKEGEVVQQGHIVAKLMDEVPKANLEVAKLTAENDVEVRYSTKLNEVDAAEYNKALDANRQHANTVPNIEIQRLRLAEQRSKLQIEKAQQEMKINAQKAKQAEAELNTYWVRAPFDGTVTRVDKHPGEAVKQGDPVLELVDTKIVQVHGVIADKDVWRVKVGAPVDVQLSLKDVDVDVERTVFHGRIGFVDAVSDAGTGETRVWAELANPENVLRPGLEATMTIFPRPAANAANRPLLPVSAGQTPIAKQAPSSQLRARQALTP